MYMNFAEPVELHETSVQRSVSTALLLVIIAALKFKALKRLIFVATKPVMTPSVIRQH